MTRRAVGNKRGSSKGRPGLLRRWLGAGQCRRVIGFVLVFLALLTFLSFLSPKQGTITDFWFGLWWGLFGWGVYVLPIALSGIGLWLILLGSVHSLSLPWGRLLGIAMLMLCGLALTDHLAGSPDPRQAQGGYLGFSLSQILTHAFGWAGALVVLLTLVGLGLGVTFDVSPAELVEGLADIVSALRSGIRAWRRWLSRLTWPWPRTRSIPLDLFLELRHSEPPPMQTPPASGTQVPQTPRLQARALSDTPLPDIAPAVSAGRRWQLPRLADILVETDEQTISLQDIRAKARLIEDTLRSLGVPVTVVEVNPGPVVTQFGLEPGYVERRDRKGNVHRVKVKVSRIAALANDLALALAASPVRIETPVPGKGVVGLEVPNSQISTVGLRGVIESDEFCELRSPLALGLGRDVSGAPVVDDLANLPHLLVAGATGSGKSVCLNALIACLLCHNDPDDLKLLMVDPKRVELSAYNGIPHLLAPVVVESERVVGVLQWLTREMERRYKVFARVGVRNIAAYNDYVAARAEPKMPYIVTFIDELADLMMVAPDDVERLICRIAQMARATGIHLVIATQRPSVDVVTGLIKANFPARIAFAVSSAVDSRVILDTPGAEKLLGRGDALYMAPDAPGLLRLQGCYVSDEELNRLIDFWKAQASPPTSAPASALVRPPTPTVERAPIQQPLWPEPKPAKGDDRDPLLLDAIRLVVEEQRASVSYLQRSLRIGYTRAARLLEMLEAHGIVGPAHGELRVRQVLVSSWEDLPQDLRPSPQGGHEQKGNNPIDGGTIA
ncbi:MAG: DNA translocase FtsK 4TM domain-containing protein [Chloroflexi bacterium]|nr:DNA translocase FtsK 4TM domain-containing protein [Chloroflexota bacterium]